MSWKIKIEDTKTTTGKRHVLSFYDMESMTQIIPENEIISTVIFMDDNEIVWLYKKIHKQIQDKRRLKKLLLTKEDI